MAALFEPYVQLVDVTGEAALIAWGGFRLARDGAGWRAERVGETFGARSEPFGRAEVEVIGDDGRVVSGAVTEDSNHVWVDGLTSATTYRYEVFVDGQPWTAGQRWDWTAGSVRPAERSLDQRLRTHATGTEPDPVTFLALGDLYLRTRFEPRQETGRASIDPGLFYRLRVGALLELVCVDTTWGAERGTHWFDDPDQRAWLERTLSTRDAVWQVPFSHHPAYCAGPNHETMAEQVDRLVPLYRQAGVRLLLHGHEHNFQHGHVDGLDYVVSGAGGKLDERPPTRLAEAGTRSWAAEPHCLLIEVAADRLTVTPYGMTPAGARAIRRRRPDGTTTDEPIVLRSG